MRRERDDSVFTDMNAASISQDQEDAVRWAVLTSDPDFADWEAFADWLAIDPGRNRLYDRVMGSVAEGAAIIAAVPPVPTPSGVAALPPTRRSGRRSLTRSGEPRRWRALVAGSAALAASIGGLMLWRPPTTTISPTSTIEATPGTTRAVALEDGSRVVLAGGSRLRIDRASPRQVLLENGRAMFTVRHDAVRPFRVVTGRHVLLDAGTAFEVVRQSGGTRIAVADGMVVADPQDAALVLRPGDAAMLPDGGGPPQRSRVVADEVGQWGGDRMSYRDAPLSRVADDLSAALGHAVSIDPRLAGRRFTGTLAPATLRSAPATLAGLLDVRVEVRQDGWALRRR